MHRSTHSCCTINHFNQLCGVHASTSRTSCEGSLCFSYPSCQCLPPPPLPRAPSRSGVPTTPRAPHGPPSTERCPVESARLRSPRPGHRDPSPGPAWSASRGPRCIRSGRPRLHNAISKASPASVQVVSHTMPRRARCGNTIPETGSVWFASSTRPQSCTRTRCKRLLACPKLAAWTTGEAFHPENLQESTASAQTTREGPLGTSSSLGRRLGGKRQPLATCANSLTKHAADLQDHQTPWQSRPKGLWRGRACQAPSATQA
mmetsp:Transcript_26242/g.86982  ORF Transcript_26242/g.86982 Transcript_26242/m.86982 type:complete len:261 (+) Transcript_26242:25-807(+)